MKRLIFLLALFVHFSSLSQVYPVVTDGTDLKYIGPGFKVESLPTNQPNITANQTGADAYYFNPEEWGIGDDPVKNRIQLQKAIDHAKSISKGRTVFKVGKTDFYIKCDGPRLNLHKSAQEYGVQLPSDFELLMTDETVIRVQPNDQPSFTMFGLHKVKNVTISGGNLIGDIDKHDFTKVKESHEYGAQIKISGGQNIRIENVHLTKGTGDNLIIGDSSNRPEAHNFMYTSKIIDFWRAQNIVVRGCEISFAGRNNVSVLSGERMLFENNKIHSCSKIEEVPIPPGTPQAPAVGIDFEAYRWVSPTDYTHKTGNISKKGQVLELERIENVLVQNNDFYNNLGGSVNFFTIYNSTFQNNYCEEGMLAAYGSQIRINNNTFIYKGTTRKEASNGFANNNLSYNIQGDRVKSEDIKIYANTFIGFTAAALIRNNNVDFFNNTLKDNNNGVVLGNGRDITIRDNTINSTVPDSKGVSNQSGSINNIVVDGNDIEVAGKAFHFFNTNTNTIADQFKIYVRNNRIRSKFHVQRAVGLEIENNRVYAPMVLENMKHFSVVGNRFNVRGSSIRGYSNQVDGVISNNSFRFDDGANYGIVLSNSKNQIINGIEILKNEFSGLKLSRGVQVYGDGDIKDVSVKVEPSESRVKSVYKLTDLKM